MNSRAPAGELGPRVQRNLQPVRVGTGEVTVWIDGVPAHVHEWIGISPSELRETSRGEALASPVTPN